MTKGPVDFVSSVQNAFRQIEANVPKVEGEARFSQDEVKAIAEYIWANRYVTNPEGLIELVGDLIVAKNLGAE